MAAQGLGRNGGRKDEKKIKGFAYGTRRVRRKEEQDKSKTKRWLCLGHKKLEAGENKENARWLCLEDEKKKKEQKEMKNKQTIKG